MKKNIKKIILSFGLTTIGFGVAGTLISCGEYLPNPYDQKIQKNLSGPTANTQVLQDFFQESTKKMYEKDKTVDISNLSFDIFQWYVHSKTLSDLYYWGNQRIDWINKGIFIDISANSTIKNIVDNEKAVNQLFTFDSTTGLYILKNDQTTYDFLKVHDNGSAGIMLNIYRDLFSMAYLLETDANDVQKFEEGDTTNTKTDNFKPEITNTGSYYYINYLRTNKPFIMWKNINNDPVDPSKAITPGKDPAIFNKLSNTIETQSASSDNLTLGGPGSDLITGTVTKLTSFSGLQISNPYSTGRTGDINPDDTYIKTTSSKDGNGGKQGWLNDDGSILATGNGVNVTTTSDKKTTSEQDYVYIQQLLPKFDTTSKKYDISNWMNTQKVGKNPVSAKWSIAYQIVTVNSSLLDIAKTFWTHYGYYLSVHVPTLATNLEPAHIYKPS